MGGGLDQRKGRDEQRGSLGTSSPGSGPGKRTLTEQLPAVQRAASSASAPAASGEQIQHTAAQGVAGAGGRPPHAETIQRLFGRHDVSGVEAHVGGDAATASRAIGAEAYATGNHVAFASSPNLHTAAHEAAHVVQQRVGVQLKGGVGQQGDAYERHADAVADLVAAGQSAEAELDRAPGGGGGGDPGVQCKTDDTPSPQQPAGSHVDRLIQLLATPPTAGHDDVYTLLLSLTMPELLATMEGTADCGYLPQLRARVTGWKNPFTSPRVLSALYVVELVRLSPSAVATEQLKAAGMALDVLPQGEQSQVIEYVLHHRGAGVNVTEVFEGALAMRDGKDAAADPKAQGGDAIAAGTTVTPSAGGAPPAPVEPGPWAPPGDQPIPFYIGNEAHAGIAANYVAAHRGESVLTNSSPIKSILEALAPLRAAQGQKIDKTALADDDLALRPDITNLTRLHLYEIKPLAAQAAGATKAATCVGLFAKAGVTVALGPTTEPGVEGGIPAPAGVYMFWSPQPGVIVYQYRKGKLVPVPFPVGEPAKERRWKFELKPMTPEQKAAVATVTVGGMLLLIAMILLAPVGA